MSTLRLILAALVSLGLLACGDDSGGQYDLTWTITSGGDETTCEQAGAATVAITSTGLEGQGEFVDSLACSTYGGRTRLLPLGRYQLTLDLLDAGGNVMTSHGPFTPNRAILANDDIVDIAPIVFAP